MRQPARDGRSDRSGNLPVELTTFVGRQGELSQVGDALSGARIVSLVGPGGVGKSRLAVRAAARVARAFPDGTWLVELGALRDPGLLTEHVAATLGLRDESGRWLVATLSDYLARRRLLLILDNCEHLVDAVAALVRAILQQASELRILATSREPLGLTAESLIHVSPLDADGPALQLLVDRAAAVRPSFRLTDATRPQAQELCRRLDGIPLAIELAAARLRGMALEDVVGRLDRRLTLLTGGDRSGPERQQTLRATLDWSYELLTEGERALWRGLAPFAGGFDAAAAAAVAAGDGTLLADDVTDVLAHLTERSLVQLEDAMTGRYRLLETIREYAIERAAEADELDRLQVRHREHYLDVARGATRTWGTAEQRVGFDALVAAYDNLRQAFDHARQSPETAAEALDVAARLWIGWQVIGRVGEGRRWVNALLAASTPTAPERPLGHWAAGYLALCQRDSAAAEEALERARTLAVDVGDQEAEAFAIGHLALVRLFNGDLPEARELFVESVDRHRRGGREAVAAFQLADAALTAALLGDTDTAVREFAESLTVSESRGDRWTQSHAHWGLGIARWMRGEPDEADREMQDALRLIREVGDPTGIALCLEGLAVTAATLGDEERAAWLVGSADAVWESIPAPPPGTVLTFRRSSVDTARETLGPARYSAAYADGRTADPVEAVKRALREVSATTPRAQPAPDEPQLSRREREVALLVAEGLTNRHIADRLVLSPRTVESHVERIMNRLGVSSRAEIAAWTAIHLANERAEIP